MKTPAAVVMGFVLLAVSAFAQIPGGGSVIPNNPNNPNNQNDPDDDKNEPTDKETRNGFWEANLAGGTYLVALGRISSVSRHKYVLDGAVIVDEVTVDTTGQALVRFYFISPIEVSGVGASAADAAQRALALVDGAARRNGTEVQDMVVKKYPLTTHSKTIEYRLFSEQQLSSLYGSVRTAWVTGKGRTFTSR